MILTITLNPLLEKVLFFDKIERNKVNRAIHSIINAGGKGINVSRQLNKFNLENLATGFLGSDNGKKLKSILYKEGIKNSFQQISEETREGIVIVENSTILESYFFPDPVISSSEVDSFIEKTKKAIANSEMLIISGSSPQFEKEDDELRLFTELISFAKDQDKIVFVDVYGKNLSSIFQLKPDIVHNNIEELQNSLGIYFKDEESIIQFLLESYNAGIKIFILTNGGEKTFAMNHGYMYEITPPKIVPINHTGSGDAFMAGLMYGFHENLPFEEMLRWAVASGSANASMFEVCSAEKNHIESIKELVIIKKLN